MIKKRLFIIIISVLLVFSVLFSSISASAFEVQELYSNQNILLYSSGSRITVDQKAVNEARKYLREHETENLIGISLPVLIFSVTVKTNKANDEDYRNEYAKKLLNEAMEHTGNPKEGDYISRQMNGYLMSYDTSKSGYLTITYTISFFTSKAEENLMDDKVKSIIKSLNLNGKSEYEKVCAIYEYLCDNVVYDQITLFVAEYSDQNLHNPTGHSAYGALCLGTSVCQGYATAFYRLALEAGIDNRVIFGEAPGGGHAWNIVRVDGQYYLIDSTWDSGKKKSEYQYFLKCEKDFPDHTPDEEHKTSSWLKKYPIAKTSYNPNKSNIIGDVDGDGKITAADSLIVLRISVNIDKTTSKKLADVDGSGTVDSLDSLIILRYSVKIKDKSNIGQKAA